VIRTVGRFVVLATFAITLAAGSAGCAQCTLQTISCPVYQPPQTPQPDWPIQCGGTRQVDSCTPATGSRPEVERRRVALGPVGIHLA